MSGYTDALAASSPGRPHFDELHRWATFPSSVKPFGWHLIPKWLISYLISSYWRFWRHIFFDRNCYIKPNKLKSARTASKSNQSKSARMARSHLKRYLRDRRHSFINRLLFGSSAASSNDWPMSNTSGADVILGIRSEGEGDLKSRNLLGWTGDCSFLLICFPHLFLWN